MDTIKRKVEDMEDVEVIENQYPGSIDIDELGRPKITVKPLPLKEERNKTDL